MEFRKVGSKTQREIVAEWDALAPTRFQQISSRQDFTFWEILVPSVFSMLELTKRDAVIDAGCGVGVLSNLLAGKARSVVGVDPSGASINIAKQHFTAGAHFFSSTLEDYARGAAPPVSVVIANMVLMDVLDLNSFLDAAFMLLRPNGSFIFSITHPFFWPDYYGYASQKWFHYEQEVIVESPFRISAQPDCQLTSTHVHRPLSAYIDALFDMGFVIELLREPMPSPQVSKMYPKPWKVPRYIVGLARREASRDGSRSRRKKGPNSVLGLRSRGG